ncbi:hypothetical protein BWZ22_09730 [Seonamhaeicola sp. S2-3]|uniref:hypothetical protein n=1 Tax=Seonamhaeicola sp. S2-3 TaxID=1936081 RepID=UPI0009729BD0|nr:hypothetical protein [Seonamhaeicola sp. S2-3]APY11506.1 hypothetical protein BWZ22_09730 [Seonamhaeicola sp. S2-3]
MKVSTEQNKQFYNLLDEFFNFASLGYHLANQNELLNAFLAASFDPDSGFPSDNVQEVIYLSTFQSEFIIKLKELWESYKTTNKIDM